MKFKLLNQKDFSLLMSGKVISLIGTQLQEFALSLYVLKVTGSATMFASVLAIGLIPQLILGPIRGVFADWLDRKKIIIYLDFLNSIIIGGFAVFYLVYGRIPLLGIYILVILQSLISVLYQPAVGVIIPSIVKKEDLIDANGINSLFSNIGMLVSPILAGILFGFYGLFLILIINAISFLIATIAEMFINVPKNNNMPEKISFGAFSKDFVEGIRFIKNEKLLIVVIGLATVLNFAFGPFSSLGLTFISKNILKVTDFQYGMIQFTLVLGMVLAPFISSSIVRKVKLGNLLFSLFFFASVMLGVTAIIPTDFYRGLFENNLIPLMSLLATCFIISLAITIGNIALSTMFQEIVPISMMGRVSTVMSTGCLAFMPLGQIVFGFLYDRLSAWICVGLTALIPIIVVLCFRKTLCNSEAKELGVENVLEAID